MAESQVRTKAASDDVSLLADISAESSQALDALFEQTNGTAPPAPELDKSKDDAAAAAEQKRKDDEAAAQKAKDDAAAAAGGTPPADEKKSDVAPTLDDTVAADKADTDAAAQKAKDDAAAAEQKAKDDAAAASGSPATPAPVKDSFDDVELPAGVKPKSAEQFAKVKELAKQTANELRTKLEAAEKARVDAETKAAEALKKIEEAAKSPLPAEVEAELKDLRGFRISKEVESDPRLKAFDAAIEKNTNGIYKKLEDTFGADAVKKIKELGGPDHVDWTPILEKLPVALKRSVEAALVDNERQKELRAEALETAKADGQKYIEERTTREVTEMTETANSFLKDLPWTKEKPIPPTATPAEKAAIEADNTFARESMAKLKAFLGDRSPAHVAELAVGTLIAYRIKADLLATQEKLKTVETGHATAVKDLQDKLTAANAEKDKLAAQLKAIRKAELPRGGGAHNVVSTPPKAGIGDTRSGADALDALAAQVTTAE